MNPRQMAVARDCERPRGITLMELIVALTLLGTILSLCWTLMSVFEGRLERSQEQSERAQLIRSLQQTLEHDLRRVQAPPVVSREEPELSAPEPELQPVAELQSEPETPATMNTRSPTAGVLSEYARADSGTSSDFIGEAVSRHTIADGTWLHPTTIFVGTSDAVLMDVTNEARPEPRLPPAREAAASTDVQHVPVPDIRRRVVYVFTAPAGAAVDGLPPGLLRVQVTSHQQLKILDQPPSNRDLRHIVKDQLPELLRAKAAWVDRGGDDFRARERNTQRDGLSPARRRSPDPGRMNDRRDTLFTNPLDDSQQATNLGEHVNYVPEVAKFRLRYFDGRRWRSSWDSRQSDQFPLAVELRFQMYFELTPEEQLAVATGAEVTRESSYGNQAARPSTEDPSAATVTPNPTDLEYDDRMLSAQQRPVNDHRYIIHFPRRFAPARESAEASSAFDTSLDGMSSAVPTVDASTIGDASDAVLQGAERD